VIGALALLLRAGAISRFWINRDEGIYYKIAHAPEPTAGLHIALNAHPPLFYYLLRGAALFGEEIVWLRVPSLVFGCLAVVAIYRLGLRLGGTAGAVAAGLLMALSPGAIVASQVARPYTLQLCALIVAVLGLFAYLEPGEPSEPGDAREVRGRWPSLLPLGVYAGSMLLAIFVHYGSICLLAGLLLSLPALAAGRRITRAQLVGLLLASLPAVVGAIALYVSHIEPQLMHSEMRSHARGSWLASQFVHSPLGVWNALLGLLELIFGSRWGGVGFVIWVASLLWCGISKRRRPGVLLALTGATLLVAIGLSALELYPLGGTRHSLHLTPLVLAAIAGGVGSLSALRRGGVGMAVPALGVLLLLGALLLGSARLNSWLGIPVGIPRPVRELHIEVEEVETLRELLEVVLDSPGILLLDGTAADVLAPLLQDVRRNSVRRSAEVSTFRWRQREVAVVGLRSLEARPERRGAPNHMLRVLAELGVLDPKVLERTDIRALVAARFPLRRSLVPSLRALAPDYPGAGDRAEAIVQDLFESPSFDFFRLDAAAYLRAVQKSEAVEPSRTGPR
jgi:hypothetical protein